MPIALRFLKKEMLFLSSKSNNLKDYLMFLNNLLFLFKIRNKIHQKFYRKLLSILKTYHENTGFPYILSKKHRTIYLTTLYWPFRIFH